MKKSQANIFTRITPDPVGQMFGLVRPFNSFESRFEIDGLMRTDGAGSIELLALLSRNPQRGQCRRFFRALKKAYRTVSVWHISNEVLHAALLRYGFQPEETVDESGDRLTGLRWDRKPLDTQGIQGNASPTRNTREELTG